MLRATDRKTEAALEALARRRQRRSLDLLEEFPDRLRQELVAEAAARPDAVARPSGKEPGVDADHQGARAAPPYASRRPRSRPSRRASPPSARRGPPPVVMPRPHPPEEENSSRWLDDRGSPSQKSCCPDKAALEAFMKMQRRQGPGH